MRRLVALVCMAGILLSLAAYGAQTEEPEKETEISGVDGEENTPSVTTEESENQTRIGTEQENILIAYFTWADNTVVEDEEAVDATSSASVLPPGNTAQMAGWIQQCVGGDLFSIVVTEPYPDDYDECLDRAADEKAENARPKLANHVESIDDYDVIFLGFPNWWYTAPMAVFSFIEEYDLSDKTIVPFCAHGTGGIAEGVRDITVALPDSAEVLEPLGVYRADIGQAQSEVSEWLENLGF